jgi:hypothetical protein
MAPKNIVARHPDLAGVWLTSPTGIYRRPPIITPACGFPRLGAAYALVTKAARTRGYSGPAFHPFVTADPVSRRPRSALDPNTPPSGNRRGYLLESKTTAKMKGLDGSSPLSPPPSPYLHALRADSDENRRVCALFLIGASSATRSYQKTPLPPT